AQTSYTMTPLYDFHGNADGASPSGGLIQDSAGNLYGTTDNSDGSGGVGVVFELSPSGNETTLYDFCNAGNNWPCPDGGVPFSTLLMDSAGNLYGTTYLGGTYGNGVVFELIPQPSGGCPANSNQGNGWCETVLYSFTGGADGAISYAALVMDSAGNLYSTTSIATNPPYASYCGGSGGGSVFELSPNSDGTWTETTLHTFTGITSGTSGDGCNPYSGVTLDNNGNLYGVTVGGGKNPPGVPVGIAYELSPTSNGPWTETILYTFGSSPTDGLTPASDLVFKEGNLYGTTEYGGSTNNGTVFELSPGSGSTWTETILYSFTGGTDGCNPYQGVSLDPQGNMYGTTEGCGNARGAGSVYELSPNGTMIPIWDFTAGTDGAQPYCTVLRDSKGNLYGTSNTGALKGSGILPNGAVWSLTPVVLSTTTTVASSGSPSTYGQSVTFTATINTVSQGVKHNAKRQAGRNLQVKPQDITGSVAWSANTGCGTTPVTFSTSGTTTCTTSVLPVGTDLVTASYSGDSGDQPSTGTLNQIVNEAKPTPIITWNPAAATYGSELGRMQLNATASYNGKRLAGTFVYTPAAGTVLTAAGTETLNVTFTPASASYTSATDSASLVVNPIKPLMKTTETKDGLILALDSTVTAKYGQPTGSVAVTSGTSGPTCDATLTGGTGTCTLTFSTGGTYTLAITYSGDSNDESVTLTRTVTVNPLHTTTKITSITPSPVPTSTPITLDFSVAASQGQPTGSVTVTSGTGGPTCSGTLTNGTGSCSLTFSAAGSYTLTATYSGDSNDAASSTTHAVRVR
ncbi:MAG: choice-of-anchor tandem repeat GloVer-containing protein, partial [Terriglobales bacterium]